MTELDLGTMFLIYNRALISRTSSEVNFFKINENGEWERYYTLPIRGFIYFIKGNIRIQISTEDKIYFYLVDKETLLPIFENVMNNYMNCLQMMIGPKVKYCVTYKNGSRAFNVFRAAYTHNFKVSVIK
jgi:hypothetical protein